MKEKKFFYYKVYGLNIKSEVKMDNLIGLEDYEKNNIDVIITYEKLEEGLLNKLNDRSFVFEDNSILCSIKDIGNYYIKDGKQIVVNPYYNADEEKIKTCILGTCLALILYERGEVAIHGAAINSKGKTFIVTGDSGAGKSTLTSFLINSGYKFKSDDVSAVRVLEDKIVAKSAYPQQKICRDTMIEMGYNLENYKLIDDGREKFIVPSHKSFIKEDLELNAIFKIEKYNGNEVLIEEVSGSERLETIVNNMYRIELIRLLGLSKTYFLKCLNVVRLIPVFRIKRPENGFTVENQIKLIEEKLKTL